MLKHFVYAVIHRETGKLINRVVYEDESKADTVRFHILPHNPVTLPRYEIEETEVVELEVMK